MDRVVRVAGAATGLLLLLLFPSSTAWTTRRNAAFLVVPTMSRRSSDEDDAMVKPSTRLFAESIQPTSAVAKDDPNQSQAPISVCGVAAPLLRVGPYPCLALRFPHWQPPVVLRFLLDTGANINSIDPNLCQKYHLERIYNSAEHVVGSAGIGGQMAPGDIYLLGDCQLHGLPAGQDQITFMRNLTAAALPGPPVSAVGAAVDGILGLSFLRSCRGVAFDWYGSDENEEDVPTVQFLFSEDILQTVQQNMTRVPLIQPPPVAAAQLPWDSIEGGGLLWMNVTVNGVELPALLDTGSPVTVFNKPAARAAGIPANNPNATNANYTGVLTVAGLDGRPIPLYRSPSKLTVQAHGKDDDDDCVYFGRGHVFVGQLPALGILLGLRDEDLDTSSQPAVVLGCDCLSGPQGMLLKISNQTAKEVWFENRHQGTVIQ